MSKLSFRLDRALTTVVFHPLRRQDASVNPQLPILMYHSICNDPQEGVRDYYKTTTSPAVFRRQMQQLASQGFKTLTQGEAVEMLNQGRRIDKKTVVITFDDGFQDFFTEAFPVLQEHRFAA